MEILRVENLSKVMAKSKHKQMKIYKYKNNKV